MNGPSMLMDVSKLPAGQGHGQEQTPSSAASPSDQSSLDQDLGDLIDNSAAETGTSVLSPDLPGCPAQRIRRKGGRKPIYATSEERKQRNRQAQAAFRERRSEYIKQLEATIKQTEQALQSLQTSHRSVSDECLMLRYKNSLLERILLEKGIDVQSELQSKAEPMDTLVASLSTGPMASMPDEAGSCGRPVTSMLETVGSEGYLPSVPAPAFGSMGPGSIVGLVDGLTGVNRATGILSPASSKFAAQERPESIKYADGPSGSVIGHTGVSQSPLPTPMSSSSRLQGPTASQSPGSTPAFEPGTGGASQTYISSQLGRIGYRSASQASDGTEGPSGTPISVPDPSQPSQTALRHLLFGGNGTAAVNGQPGASNPLFDPYDPNFDPDPFGLTAGMSFNPAYSSYGGR